MQEQSGLDKSKILNFLIDNAGSKMHSPFLNETKNDEKKKKIVLYLSLDEYDKLKQSAGHNLRGSVAKELKFHALNGIYETRIPNAQESQSLNATKAQLHKIGSNINQIARAYNTQINPNAEDKLLLALSDLKQALNQLSQDIKTLLSNKRRLA